MRRLNICCAVAVLLFAGLLCIFAKAQKHEPLTEVETIRLLQGGVTPDRVAKVAKESGIAFAVTPAVERELNDAGANDRLLQTLRELAAEAGGEKGKKESVKTDTPATTTGILLITVDAPCKLNVDGDEAGTLAAGIPKRVNVPFGDHLVHAVSTEEAAATVDWTGKVETPQQQLVQLKLAEMVSKQVAARKAKADEAERAEQANLRNFTDIIGKWTRTYKTSYIPATTRRHTIVVTHEDSIEVRAADQHGANIEGMLNSNVVDCSRDDKRCRVGRIHSYRIVLSHGSPGEYTGTQISADGGSQAVIHIKLISPTNLEYSVPLAVDSSTSVFAKVNP